VLCALRYHNIHAQRIANSARRAAATDRACAPHINDADRTTTVNAAAETAPAEGRWTTERFVAKSDPQAAVETKT